MRTRRCFEVTLMVLAFGFGACSDDDGGGSADSGADRDGAVGADTGGTDSTGGTDADVQTDAGVGDDAAPTGDSGEAAATFTAIYENVISVKCTPCHTVQSNGNLSMSDRATALTNLVGVAAAGGACASSGLTRVVADDAANSLLVQKLEGTQTCGQRMPLGQAQLSAAEIEQVKQWIEAGAQDN